LTPQVNQLPHLEIIDAALNSITQPTTTTTHLRLPYLYTIISANAPQKTKRRQEKNTQSLLTTMLPTPTNAPPPPSSQQPPPSSHFPISPLPASLLLDRELARKGGPARKGSLVTTGCGELDDYVLLGGFERGSVVGVSAEGEEVGVLVCLLSAVYLLIYSFPFLFLFSFWSGWSTEVRR
jgi:hypothetical protein